MKNLIVFFFLLTFFTLSVHSAKFTHAKCSELGSPESPEVLNCVNKGNCTLKVKDAFKRGSFGAPSYYEPGVIDCLKHTVNVCKEKEKCTDSKNNCYLPSGDLTADCKKAEVFNSPFGDCMRKLKKQKASSADLETFVKYSPAVRRKCVLLKTDDAKKSLENAILKDCGGGARDAFVKHFDFFKTHHCHH